jgi:hypothetical protein
MHPNSAIVGPTRASRASEVVAKDLRRCGSHKSFIRRVEADRAKDGSVTGTKMFVHHSLPLMEAANRTSYSIIDRAGSRQVHRYFARAPIFLDGEFPTGLGSRSQN